MSWNNAFIDDSFIPDFNGDIGWDFWTLSPLFHIFKGFTFFQYTSPRHGIGVNIKGTVSADQEFDIRRV